MGVVIKLLGSYIPNEFVSNDMLSEVHDIEPEWILERTGIEKRALEKEGATSNLAVSAIQDAFRDSELGLDIIDCLIVATVTPDHQVPSVSSIIQNRLGVNNIFSFDINAGCAGFIYGLELANNLILSKRYKNVLVVGVDKLSSILNKNDFKTSLIFGDGAGCALISYDRNNNHLIEGMCSMDSTSPRDILIRDGGSKSALQLGETIKNDHLLTFTSKNIFSGGVELFQESIQFVLKKRNLSLDEIDLIVPHQANKRMIEALSNKMNFPIEKFHINIENIGNTSSASIPICLKELKDKNLLNGNILITAVGAGYTYGAYILNFKNGHQQY